MQLKPDLLLPGMRAFSAAVAAAETEIRGISEYLAEPCVPGDRWGVLSRATFVTSAVEIQTEHGQTPRGVFVATRESGNWKVPINN